VGLKLNGTLQQLVYADDVNLLGGNTENLIDASEEVGLEVNAGKTDYTLRSRHQNAGQNHDIKRANRFEIVVEFKYSRTQVANQN
jgi:hypothetical protein